MSSPTSSTHLPKVGLVSQAITVCTRERLLSPLSWMAQEPQSQAKKRPDHSSETDWSSVPVGRTKKPALVPVKDGCGGSSNTGGVKAPPAGSEGRQGALLFFLKTSIDLSGLWKVSATQGRGVSQLIIPGSAFADLPRRLSLSRFLTHPSIQEQQRLAKSPRVTLQNPRLCSGWSEPSL